MKINGKKYSLSKFSWLIIGIISAIIIVTVIYIIFFRIPKADRIKDYLTCNMHYTEDTFEADITKTVTIGVNYENKMVNNNITDIYYFKDETKFNNIITLFNSDNISKNKEYTFPKYSFDKKNLAITVTVTLEKKASTYKKLPKYKKDLKTYYEDKGMTCN